MPNTTIWSATESTVTVTPPGTVLEGVQSIEFKVSRSRTDIFSSGKEIRDGVNYGSKIITGKLRIKSTCPQLDDLLKVAVKDLKTAEFSMHVELIKGDAKKTVDFQSCYLDDRDFEMEVNGVGVAVYTFTAADVNEA